jgi:hypothetical protein
MNPPNDNISTEQLNYWLNLPAHVRSALAQQNAEEEIRGRAELVYSFLRSNNLAIPRFTKQDLDERYGFAMASLQNALDSRFKSLSAYYRIVTVSPFRDDDGNLIMNELIMHHKKYTQMIQLLIGRCAVYHSANVIGTFHDFLYEEMDEFDFTYKDSAHSAKARATSTAARTLGIPTNLLPLARSHTNEFIFGNFDVCYGVDRFSCKNGNWPFCDGDAMGDMAKAIYTTEPLPHSRRWCIVGNMKKVKRLVIFEKVTLARQFWKKLATEEKEMYILLVTGGMISHTFLLIRKFICLTKKALCGTDFFVQCSTGDVDPSSFNIQYNMENNENLGPGDRHLMMNVHMIGPFPNDGK